jgi:hypothetical protein
VADEGGLLTDRQIQTANTINRESQSVVDIYCTINITKTNRKKQTPAFFRA